MKTRIVRIGNSQGIRIPKVLLEEVGLEGEVELKAERGELSIRPIRSPRAGWAEAFAEGDDDALGDDIPPSLSSWDEEEWEWR